MNKRIISYRFADSKVNVITLAVIHLGLGILLLVPPGAQVWSWGRPQLCLLLALGFFALYRLYDWRSTANNLIWLGLYLLSLLYEFTAYGFPGAPMAMSDAGTLGKGIFTEMFIQSLPAVYVGLRLIMTVLLLTVIRAGWQLNKVDS